MTRPWSQRPLLVLLTALKTSMWTLREPLLTSLVYHYAGNHNSTFYVQLFMYFFGFEKMKKERKKHILAFRCRERSNDDFPLASEIWREKPPTPHSPPAAWLPGLCGLLFQCFLLLLLITLPPIILFLLSHHPPLSIPHQVSPSRLRSSPGPAYECTSSLPIRQPWQ